MIPIINRFTCTRRQLPMMINTIQNKNMNVILDYSNENKVQHQRNFHEIMDLIQHYPNHHIAIKLSSLNIQNKDMAETYLEDITKRALQNNCKLLIDAENYEIQDDIYDMSDKFIKQYNKNEVNIYKTYQLYRNDSMNVLKYDMFCDRDYFLGFKLVRGAYYNEDKVHNILFDTIEETHANYDEGIELFFKQSKPQDKLLCATHNEDSILKTIHMLKIHNTKNVSFAQLLGMSDQLSRQLSKEHRIYKYVPYGDFQDTLPYLIRRLYENYPILLNIFK